MTTLDFILLAIIVVSALYGYHKGIVAQIGALAGVLVGILCCRMFSDDFASLLNDVFLDSASTKASSLFLNSVIAQVVLFLVGYFGARWGASLLSKVLKTIKLGTINSIAGSVFAVVQGLVLFSLLLNVWIAINPSTDLVKSSTSIVDEHVINLAPDIFGSDTAKEMFFGK